MDALTKLRSVFQRFSDAEGSTLAASLAYYTLFAMPPLLFTLVTVVSLGMSAIYDRDVAQDQAKTFLESKIGELIGSEAAGVEVGNIIERAKFQPGKGWKALLSLLAIIAGATGIIVSLQAALNRIWGVRPLGGMFSLTFLMKRVFSLGMIVGFGILLTVSLVLTMLLNIVGDQLAQYSGLTGFIPWLFNFAFSLFVSWVFFTLVFRIMPDAVVSWRAAISGGLFTVALFTLGRLVLATYLQYSNPGAQLGSAAASLMVIIIWVYYSSMILLLGAVFTAQYSGEPVATPEAGAVNVEERTVGVRPLRDRPHASTSSFMRSEGTHG